MTSRAAKKSSIIFLALTALASLLPAGRALAEPVRLGADKLDRVTAGATAAGAANAVAFGANTLTEAVTNTAASERWAKGFASALAVGPQGAGASTVIELQGEMIAAGASGLATTSSGVAQVSGFGRLVATRKHEAAVITTVAKTDATTGHVETHAWGRGVRGTHIEKNTHRFRNQGQLVSQTTIIVRSPFRW